eukprot:CAMPEP_0167744210 /NCGR_PEP_ID=MMETSP0110_2-20121227/2458_1 /TAXON_ID=629695 /ORGANISM="Gymnochlora sp., Strain CCMP2014" /LENGTH=71 /DNA_ID=CAMNT_0007628693 /DNA_START=467 /DNA_END=682 /DNA_ORIENTATION=-
MPLENRLNHPYTSISPFFAISQTLYDLLLEKGEFREDSRVYQLVSNILLFLVQKSDFDLALFYKVRKDFEL